MTLRTRNNNDYTGHYPQVADDLQQQPQQELVLDGEMVALDEKGVPDFNLMQHSAEIARRGLSLGGDLNIVYYPFDILHLGRQEPAAHSDEVGCRRTRRPAGAVRRPRGRRRVEELPQRRRTSRTGSAWLRWRSTAPMSPASGTVG